MTVYVIQNTHHKDHVDGQWKPKFDFTPALQFGELSFLLGHEASPYDLRPVQRLLHQKLANFSNKDYLLCVGSPVLIGLAVAIAADYNHGHVAMLQWKGTGYFPARALDIFATGPGDRSI